MRGDQIQQAKTEPDSRFRWRSLRDFVVSLMTGSGTRGMTVLAMVAAGAVVEGVGLVMLVPIIGLVLGSGPAPQAISWLTGLVGGDRTLVMIGALTLFMAVMILRGLIIYARDRLTWRLQQAFIAEQRNRIIAKLAAARWSALVSLDHAQVTSQLSGEIGRIAVATTMLFQIIVATGLLVVQAGLVIALAPGLGSLVTGIALVTAVPIILRFSRITGLGQKTTRGGVDLMTSIGTLLSGLKVAQAQGMQGRFIDDFVAVQARHVGYQAEFARGRSRDQLIFGIVSAVAASLLVGVGIGVFATPPAILLTMIVIFTRIVGPIRSLQTALPQLVFMLPAYESITALARRLDAARAPARARDRLDHGALVFHDVGYVHAGGRGLHHASFTIAPGETVGICGPSGGGKTTLLDLAIGLIEPQSGRITVGNTPLTTANVGAWADRIAYATQEPFLFHDSIRRNITWGIDCDDAAIWRAVEAMGAGALVHGMPMGLETIIGDRGTLLSGGERQRLILARALLRQPALLILDEATSSLDAPSEAAIVAAFKALDPRPTILFVTHRAESLANCDRVLRLENGAVQP